jgi:hypothetical protein
MAMESGLGFPPRAALQLFGVLDIGLLILRRGVERNFTRVLSIPFSLRKHEDHNDDRKGDQCSVEPPEMAPANVE